MTQDTRLAARRAFETLPKVHRLVFMLSYYDCMNYCEIAECIRRTPEEVAIIAKTTAEVIDEALSRLR